MTTHDSLATDARAALEARDPAALSALFADDGRVLDDGDDHVGPDAVARWFASTPPVRLEVVSERRPGSAGAGAGAYEFVAKAHGDYPQSPLTFRHRFELGEKGIRSLEITVVDLHAPASSE